MNTALLISLSGLPGVGKTTIARELARRIGAVHVCVDSIESALHDSNGDDQNHDAAAYRAASALTADNLSLGRIVIADAVNRSVESRTQWCVIARTAGVRIIEVEVICSDTPEWRRRIPGTGAQHGSGIRTPRWEQVARDYQPWERDRIVIDTAGRNVRRSVAELRSHCRWEVMYCRLASFFSASGSSSNAPAGGRA